MLKFLEFEDEGLIDQQGDIRMGVLQAPLETRKFDAHATSLLGCTCALYIGNKSKATPSSTAVLSAIELIFIAFAVIFQKRPGSSPPSFGEVRHDIHSTR